MDSDVVCITNANRQLQATSGNVGKVKVEELKKRLLEINPLANVEARQEIYNPETRESFDLESYDYIIDAIDSLSYKVDLLITAMATGKTVLSSMGAACKRDPTRIHATSIWKTKGCPLAREVRKRLQEVVKNVSWVPERAPLSVAACRQAFIVPVPGLLAELAMPPAMVPEGWQAEAGGD